MTRAVAFCLSMTALWSKGSVRALRQNLEMMPLRVLSLDSIFLMLAGLYSRLLL